MKIRYAQLSDISKIYNIEEDTYKKEGLFFSHRRSTHNDKFFTGRMINIIGFARKT